MGLDDVNFPSITQMGDASFSDTFNDGEAKTVATMRVTLSDGRELTFSNEYGKGMDRDAITSDMEATIEKTIHIPILHGLGDPNRKNPTSSISLMGDGSVVKNYAQSGKESKVIKNYAEYVQSKATKYVKRLEESDLDTAAELQRRLESIKNIQQKFL